MDATEHQIYISYCCGKHDLYSLTKEETTTPLGRQLRQACEGKVTLLEQSLGRKPSQKANHNVHEWRARHGGRRKK